METNDLIPIHQFWEIFENMDEVFYVADMDTHELIYINRKGRIAYGFPSMESLAGRECYEILQHSPVPCAMCTNDQLKPGQFYEWKHHNPLLNKTFILRDTMFIHNGHRLRLEFSMDTTRYDEQKQTLKEFASNEALVNDALRQALSARTPVKSLDVLTQYLGQTLRCDRVYIFEENEEGSYDNTYEWCAVGVTPEKDNLQKVPYDVVKFWFKRFRDGQNIVIKNLEEIRMKDPLVYEYLAPQNINTLVVGPLISNGKIFGFYGVDNPPASFLNHISSMFQVLGHFMSSLINSRNLVLRLETLSYYDHLCGVKNRHAMNDLIENVDHDASIGVLYCDVMGLKQVNDTLGHLEGDALLRRASDCLQKHFPPDSIYRIGGDEFLVIHSGSPREDMESRIQAMQADLPNFSVKMACGFVWQERCNRQITDLLHQADQKMYADKEQYYALHPEERRK